MRVHRAAVDIPLGRTALDADLAHPPGARGFVLIPFTGLGLQRADSRDAFVGHALQAEGYATLLFSVLTHQQERHLNLRYNIKLLSQHVLAATRWLDQRSEARAMPFAYYASGTAGAACVRAALQFPERIRALALRSARADLAGAEPLRRLRCPTLLIIGGHDRSGLEPNQHALQALRCEKELAIVASASELFAEPGTLDQAARLAIDWIGRCIAPE